MSRHRAGHAGRPRLLLTGASAAVLAVLFGVLTLTDPVADTESGSDRPRATIVPASETVPEAAPEALPPMKVHPGVLLRRKPEPRGPVLVKGGTGRVGTGLTVGPPGEIDAPVGVPVQGTITTGVANLPNRTSDSGFASSLGTLTAADPDFVMLNEVSGRSVEGIQASAPGYDAYRDPQSDGSLGGTQSMNNIVMWRSDRWTLVDAGRVKLVDNDTGYNGGRPFTWDRYATWAMLQREDGAIVSVVSTHMMTNPARFPRQPGNPGESRIERYGRGMDVLLATTAVLDDHGPVLVGGDMNSHPTEGPWTAAAKMTAGGYEYTKDQGVMYLFYQDGVQLTSSREVAVASDHPALVTTLDMNGQGPS